MSRNFPNNRFAAEEDPFSGDDFFEPTDLGFVAPAPVAAAAPVAATPVAAAPAVPVAPAGPTVYGVDRAGNPVTDPYKSYGEYVTESVGDQDFRAWVEKNPFLLQGPVQLEGYAPNLFDFSKHGFADKPDIEDYVQSGENMQGGYAFAGVTPAFADWFKSQGLGFQEAHGPGYSRVLLTKDGKPIDEYFQKQSKPGWFERLVPSLILGVAAPGIGSLLGGGLMGAAGAGAITGGLGAAMQGGDVLKGALRGGITGGIGSAASPYIGQAGQAASEAVGGGQIGNIVSKAVQGAGSSALGAALTGGDIGEALISGGLGAGTGAAVNAATSGLFDQLDLPAPVERVAGTALSSALLGRDVESAVVKSIVNEILREARQPSVTDTGDETERLKARFPAPIPDTGDEVDRLLARYPESSLEPDFVVEQTPSGAVVRDTAGETFQGATEEPIFLGEGVPSGISPWDAAAIAAEVPLEGVTGNLEQDFVVAQTRDGPVIMDTAGNMGEFMDGEWVVRSDPKDFSTYVAPSPAPAPAPAPKPAPAPSPAPATKSKDNLDALLLALAMMQQPQSREEPYQVAQIAARSPFGSILDGASQDDLLRIMRG